MGNAEKVVSRREKLISALLLVGIVAASPWQQYVWLGVMTLVAAYAVGELMSLSDKARGKPGTQVMMWVFGVYVVVGMGYAIVLRTSPQWMAIIGLTVVASTFTDAGGWFFGGRFGEKGTFFEAVSPNKSLTGFITGCLSGTTMGSVVIWIAWATETPLDYERCLFLVATIPIISVAGDLFASKIKRLLEIKDFGNTIPGHGGMSDRLDSLALAAVWTGTAMVVPHLLWHTLIAVLVAAFLIKERNHRQVSP
ncbi:MAG: phosphatidate cytidylyltransferase [Candidatus Saccharimonadales bacterium]